jgi:Tfp pilus assembly protein PilF
MNQSRNKRQQDSLWSELAHQMGDQRTEDLIEEARASEPEEAIKLLQKALRYDRTSFRARVAYALLATQHEELDHKPLAVKYFTKALEIGGPSARILYRRGVNYYAMEKWNEALHDFMEALTYQTYENLSASEREEAENYLVKLAKKIP